MAIFKAIVIYLEPFFLYLFYKCMWYVVLSLLLSCYKLGIAFCYSSSNDGGGGGGCVNIMASTAFESHCGAHSKLSCSASVSAGQSPAIKSKNAFSTMHSCVQAPKNCRCGHAEMEGRWWVRAHTQWFASLASLRNAHSAILVLSVFSTTLDDSTNDKTTRPLRDHRQLLDQLSSDPLAFKLIEVVLA